jgi:hypothetical protein
MIPSEYKVSSGRSGSEGKFNIQITDLGSLKLNMSGTLKMRFHCIYAM